MGRSVHKIRQNLRRLVSRLCKRSRVLRFLVKAARYALLRARYLSYTLRYPVQKGEILFETFQGARFCDSPKALYEEICRDSRFDGYRLVWSMQRPEDAPRLAQDARTQVVRTGTGAYYRALARAQYIVTNARGLSHLKKRRGQTVLQTWHGTPLKRLGCDVLPDYENPFSSVREIHRQYEAEARRLDYLLSPSPFATEKLSSAFHLKEMGKAHAVLEQGYPRNDFLFRYTEDDVRQIRADLGLPPEKQVILYAPTFRDNAHRDGVGYTLEKEIDFSILREALGESYIILFRAHYFVADTFDFAPWEGFLYDVSAYQDINYLYVVSDLLVTDYSSVFFDYANLGRPILFYMYDLEQYRDRLRGFYLELSDLPGPVVRTERELASAIQQGRWTGCDREAFRRRFNPYEDGNAGRRVLDAVWFSEHDRSLAGE